MHSLLYGGSRCVAGDTVLDGHTATIADLALIGSPVVVVTSHGLQMAEAPFRKGECELLKIVTDTGRAISVTPDHRFWDGLKWIKAQDLEVGASLACRVRPCEQSLPASSLGLSGPLLLNATKHDTPVSEGYSLETVASITTTAKQDYYTLHVPVTEQYFANGFLNHNSGKTLLALRAKVIRRLRVPSRGACLRFRFGHIKESLVLDTFPKLMSMCFPDVPYKLNKSDWYVTFPNGSEEWFGGLDDKDRVDKILGKEYADILFEEVSQISFASVETALSRLAQKTDLALRAYYTENPPTKGHWTYKQFKLLMNPANNNPLPDPERYQSFFMKPDDNAENIAGEYLDILKNMSGQRRKRFYEGEFADENPNALWTIELLDGNRVLDGSSLPDFQRIIVAVDPSGSGDTDNQDNDAIGIVVMALGTDGRAYLLEDLTIKAGPSTWGGVAYNALVRHKADCIVAETNYGGAMVHAVVKTAAQGKSFMFKPVNATRGKVVRAEPIAALAVDGKIRHVGHFNLLEDELCGFSTTGYTGESSPNRADAYVWAATELFPQLVRAEKVVPLKQRKVFVP